ncbi:MAG TPA: amidohydrolase family protein [Chloroflexota bacterium]|nr:amidohydrolase family protein [Chloroflexota bacterium]
MPTVPVIDSHVHLWDPSRFRMVWLDGNSILERPYTVTDYRSQTSGLGVEGLVYVQVDVEPAYGLLEAEWIASVAREDPLVQGIVAWAPLEDGDRSHSFLSALRNLGTSMKGVRRLIQSEPDPNFCLRADFVRAVQSLPEFGLSFDICIQHRQLASVVELVRRCPETAFVLDHVAKPAIRDGLQDPWREQIQALAALPNVACKISGMVTEADHQNWSIADVEPYVQHIWTSFGEDRVMFGSDWPVVLQAATYRRWVETLDTLLANQTETARRKFWSENARQFYRLAAK